MMTTAPEAPLAGITVVELGHSVAAPYAGQVLGELGATIIKIEKQEGDDARKWGPPFTNGSSAVFASYNRNKLSVVADLNNMADRDALRRLIIERADVVIQNLRPGGLEKYALDGPALRRDKPELIYVNLGAFGATGPLRNQPGYDPLMQAFGGIMSVTGESGQPSVRVGVSMVDIGTGMWAVIGILSALLRRKASGEGCAVDTSLFETSLSWMGSFAAMYVASGEVATRQGSGSATIAPYRAYACKDGEIVIAAGNDNLFRILATVLGHPNWADDPRFLRNSDRVQNKEILDTMIEDIIATDNCSKWNETLEAVGVPCAQVQTIAQVLAHPQTKALGMLQPDPGAGVSLIGLPLSFDGTRPPLRRAPPTLGQDTAVVWDSLKSIGVNN